MRKKRGFTTAAIDAGVEAENQHRPPLVLSAALPEPAGAVGFDQVRPLWLSCLYHRQEM